MTERQSIYDAIGGIDKIDELVDRFYDLMALESVFSDLRAMHPRTFRALERSSNSF